MTVHSLPVPRLTTAQSGPLYPIEETLLNQVSVIEDWFRHCWRETPPPITSSVDLRHAGFKLAPVDTNLFPAGFNNLNPDFLPLCIQAAQSILGEGCTHILLLPESHTRNRFYLQSLATLRDIFSKAGFVVRIGTLDPNVTSPFEVVTEQGQHLRIEPVIRDANKIKLIDFEPCLLLLNNDLSTGIPDVLLNLEQVIQPSSRLGWGTRLKSTHFEFYTQVAQDFARVINIDSWLFDPIYASVSDVDFMKQTGIEQLAEQVDRVLARIQEKYHQYGIQERPFVAVKADNGTYGMGVMTVQDGATVLQLNRKQRTGMSSLKGSRKVDRVLIQEGVYSFETMSDQAVAEPVVYMMGQFVVGGFYRVHKGRGKDENLNSPGMHFEPLAFSEPCNMPCLELDALHPSNRFYAYGVIARLAALAAAREISAIEGRS